MERLVALAVFSVIVPASVISQAPVRNAYAEANFLGAKTFLHFVDKAGLNKTLKDPRANVTVFAPTEVAFSHLSPSVLSRLNTDTSFLQQVISFHLAPGLQTVHASNNHVFSTMANVSARINVFLDPNITTVSGSSVLLDDRPASNGLVSMLNRVMSPVPAGTALTVVTRDSFDMLLLALTKAGVISMLKEPDITVFAPSNSAFQKLPPGVFADLLDDVPLLTKVLRNHVVKEVVFSAYVLAKGGAVLHSESGLPLNVTVTGSGTVLQIGPATVTSPDLNADNGVVHVIDTVLLPP